MEELVTFLRDAAARQFQLYPSDSLELTIPPPTEVDLGRVEAALGVPLSAGYRYLMLNYGTGMPLDPYINWYRPASANGYRGLIENNVNRPVPHLLYILACTNGDNFALDTTRHDEAGEPAVVLADHETADEQTKVVAASLAAFIHRWTVLRDADLLRLA